jgi:REP element-mobilizing transposase RayT
MRNSRHSIRIKDYDYSQANIYFVTICTNKQTPIFGTIKNDKVNLNDGGRIVDAHWRNIPTHYSNVSLDEYIVMPDHLHGLIFIGDIDTGAMNGAPTENNAPAKIASVSNILSCFKAGVTREMGKSTPAVRYPLWQRNYYEHVIRNLAELNKIRQYIINNPLAKSLKADNPEIY